VKIKSSNEKSATVELTTDELHVLNNALNEVCNGIHLEDEFSTRMGCSLEEARELLKEIHGFLSK
jgi:hypothetical protein